MHKLSLIPFPFSLQTSAVGQTQSCINSVSNKKKFNNICLQQLAHKMQLPEL